MNRPHIMSGSQGQLLSDIISIYRDKKEYSYIPCNRKQLDVVEFSSLAKLFKTHNPEIFIQGASSHNVEDLENDSKNAVITNIASLHELSKLCNEYDCTLINFSTNYVFGGKLGREYETNFNPDPVNFYGITKAAGEAVLANYCNKYLNFRVAGLFGRTGSRAKNGNNFIFTVLNKLEKDGSIEVVDDQYCNVTYTKEAASIIYKIIEVITKDSSILDNLKDGNYNFHLTNYGTVTWYEVAKFVAILKGYSSKSVIPISTESFYSNINRPAYTQITNSDFKSLFNIDETMSNWQEGVIKFLRDIGELT